MPEPLRPMPTPPNPPSDPGGAPAREGVPPRATGGGVRARVEGVLAAASASETVIQKGVELATYHRGHATLLPHLWFVLGDPDRWGRVDTYITDLLEPSCTCAGWFFMPAVNKAAGLVCKHIVCAALMFLKADSEGALL